MRLEDRITITPGGQRESDVTLKRLQHFHRWEPGDLILWDNWRAMHCATGVKPGMTRVIHRTTIMGDATLGRVLEQ